MLNDLPYVRHLGIELTEAADGYAAGRLALEREHSSVPGGGVAHGGVPYALADTVGGAAVMSLHWKPTPTVDMRIDYLAPATGDLRAEARVVRDGGHVSMVDVDVDATDGTHVASARGVFKTGGGEGGSVWTDEAAFDGAGDGIGNGE